MIEEGYISMAVAEPAVLFGRASTQYAIRVLNGDRCPTWCPGSSTIRPHSCAT